MPYKEERKKYLIFIDSKFNPLNVKPISKEFYYRMHTLEQPF